jgi:hypothetical protein
MEARESGRGRDQPQQLIEAISAGDDEIYHGQQIRAIQTASLGIGYTYGMTTPASTPGSYADLLADIESLKLENKISEGRYFSDFSEYLTENPDALTELAQLVGELPGGMTEERVAGLFHWAQRLNMGGVRLIRRVLSGTLDILYQGGEGNIVSLSGSGSEDYKDVKSSATEQAIQDVLYAEAAWKQLGNTAPVVKVCFSGQTEDSKGNILQSHEEDRFEWEGTNYLFSLGLDQRNAACEMDSYESDELLRDDNAPQCATGWDGPFAISTKLYRPSAHLLSLREAAKLSQITAGAGSRMRGVRL